MIRDPLPVAAASTTSITSMWNDETAVPRTTDRPVHCMPARTSPSGMIGSPADAVAAGTSSAAASVGARRRARMGGAM